MTGARATTIDTFNFASLLDGDHIRPCPVCHNRRLVRCPNCGPHGHHRDGFDADGWCRRCDCGPQAPAAWRQIQCPCDDL